MYSVIMDNKPEEESFKSRDIKINFGKLYLFLLIFNVSLIYYYSVYQDNYLTILIPYKVLWPVSIIMIGLSMLRAKNTAAFSLSFFITILSVGITITSIFVYQSSVQNNSFTSLIPVKDAKGISFDIKLISTQAKIRSEGGTIFRGDFVSNYDTLISNNYMDENKIENIKIEQNFLPPGLGAYTKSSDIILPTNIPTVFKMAFNVSSVRADLSNIKLESGAIKVNNSILDMVIKDIDLDENVTLDINSNFSLIDIVVSKNIPVILSYSSNLSQSEFIGIDKSTSSSNVYQTSVQETRSGQESSPDLGSKEEVKELKQLIINLNYNCSRIKVTQK